MQLIELGYKLRSFRPVKRLDSVEWRVGRELARLKLISFLKEKPDPQYWSHLFLLPLF